MKLIKETLIIQRCHDFTSKCITDNTKYNGVSIFHMTGTPSYTC